MTPARLVAPEEALLVRHPAVGGHPAYWDPLYGIDGHGTRQICVVSDTLGYVMFAYAAETGVNDIVYKNIYFADLDPNNPTKFYNQPRQTLVSGGLSKNVNSTKAPFNNEIVLVGQMLPRRIYENWGQRPLFSWWR